LDEIQRLIESLQNLLICTYLYSQEIYSSQVPHAVIVYTFNY